MSDYYNDINRPSKIKEQEQVRADIEAFLAAGGEIQHIPYGQISAKGAEERAKKASKVKSKK